LYENIKTDADKHQENWSME